METKIVQKFGNSGHIVLPKEYIGRRIRFITKTKTFNQIKIEILNILTSNIENISGAYLYGSYARNEETLDSDVDIFIISNKKLKILHEEYNIVSLTEEQIKNTLEKNAVLILPIIKESKTIINPNLIDFYKDHKLTQKNTKTFIEECERILKINKHSLELNIGVNSINYSLILRIRGLLILNLMLENKLYTKSKLFSQLGKNFTRKKVQQIYNTYTKVRDNKKIDKDIITKKDLKILIKINENLLEKIKKHKWEKTNTKKE